MAADAVVADTMLLGIALADMAVGDLKGPGFGVADMADMAVVRAAGTAVPG